MPFKLRIRKTRSQYNVSSKSLFVLSVEILDNSNIECTLTADSLGQECLDNVCQKLSIGQPEFFGLQFESRTAHQYRSNPYEWLDLSRPVKKQLDKYALNMLLHLRVLYFTISGVRLISCEQTRYQYFQQLKHAVLEGHLICIPTTAVQLASYAMQAEFGNYDPERHTNDYLKQFQLFPKVFSENEMIESLTEAAIEQHRSLHGLPSSTAEELYISSCQQLHGYGQEAYHCKSQTNQAVTVCVSLTGIRISAGNPVVLFYRWLDISNVINYKRCLSIECPNFHGTEQFFFADMNSAKMVWKMCVFQHKFFMKFEQQWQMDNKSPVLFHKTQSVNVLLKSNSSTSSIIGSISANSKRSSQSVAIKRGIDNDYTNVIDNSIESEEKVKIERNESEKNSSQSLNSNNNSNSQYLLPSYRTAPDYETVVKFRNSQLSIENVKSATSNSTKSQQPDVIRNEVGVNSNGSNSNCNENNENGAGGVDYKRYVNRQLGLIQMYNNQMNRFSSNSTPDLASSSSASSHLPSSSSGGGSGNNAAPFLCFQQSRLLQSQQPLLHNQHLQQQQQQQQHLQINTHKLLNGSSPDLVSSGLSTNYLAQINHYNHKMMLMNNQMGKNGDLAPMKLGKAYQQPNNQQQLVYSTFENLSEALNEERVRENYNFVIKTEQSDAFSGKNSSSCRGSGTSGHNNTVLNNSEPIYENIPYSNSSQSNSTKSNNSSNIITQNGGKRAESMNSAIVSDEVQTSRRNRAIEERTAEIMLNSSGESRTSQQPQLQQQQQQQQQQKQTSKKKRWLILPSNKILISAGRLISEKSATLGREKKRNAQTKINSTTTLDNLPKHRWSTTNNSSSTTNLISKEMLCDLIEEKLQDNLLFTEFENIFKKKPNADFSTAQLNENLQLNRFKDVLPYEENRVRLTPSKDNKYGYVNASNITASVGQRQMFYIAAQGPTNDLQLSVFWQCVWEADVYMIVQLNTDAEDLDYLPNGKQTCKEIGQYQVCWEFSQEGGHCSTSKFRLCHAPSRRYRTIWHLRYQNWNEKGCPQSEGDFLGFLYELRYIRQYSVNEIPQGYNKNPPVLVHCTAGVGRTGLTILCDLLLNAIDHNQDVDVRKTVELLRHQRVFMVQTLEQYIFVYFLLVHYLKQSRLI